MLAEGKIAAADLDLLVVADTPEQVRDLVVQSVKEQRWRSEQEAEARAVTRRALTQAGE